MSSCSKFSDMSTIFVHCIPLQWPSQIFAPMYFLKLGIWTIGRAIRNNRLLWDRYLIGRDNLENLKVDLTIQEQRPYVNNTLAIVSNP